MKKKKRNPKADEGSTQGKIVHSEKEKKKTHKMTLLGTDRS